MNLNEVIYKRKSVRSYTNQSVDDATLAKIRSFAENARPLYPEIKTRMEIADRSSVRCIFPWTTQQLISIYTEDAPGDLENIGFIYQQLDLYLQSLGLGACWLGMGRMKKLPAEKGMKFAIMLAFGHPKGAAQRASLDEFKRKNLSEISDIPDERLKPAQFAPSSVNSQPWRFTHEGDTIHVHCVQQGMMKAVLSDFNRIDTGIALAHMYVANPDSFRFFRAENIPSPRGCAYIGSFTL